MSNAEEAGATNAPLKVNFVSQGSGAPIVLVHGLAASLHDWDAIIPDLLHAGYATYAVDLLGHGDSAKPPNRLYQMDWVFDHFSAWIQSLSLSTPPVLIGHSLGGYIALEYARRFPDAVKALVLVDPFYSNGQLPAFMRFAYSHPSLTSFFIGRAPVWVVRLAIDVMSMFMGHSKGGLHALPEDVRQQTALDYARTAPAAYGILQTELNLTPHLGGISMPTLVVWGERDSTLAPASFPVLVKALPQAAGRSRATGHVPHQAETEWFNQEVLAFLEALGRR